MRSNLARTCTFGIVAILTSTVANAANIIGVDFVNGSGTPQSPANTDVVGPVASAGWNNTVDLTNAPFFATAAPTNPSTSLLTLKDDTNANTSAKFGMNNYGYATLNGPTTYAPNYGADGSGNAGLTPNQQLYNGATGAGAGAYAQQVSLFDVPYATYDVYVLVKAWDGAVGYPPPTGGYGNVTGYTNYNSSTQLATQVGTYWFYSPTAGVVPPSGFSYVQATGTSMGTATSGANYVLFSGLTGGIGTSAIFDLQSPATDGNYAAFIGAIEIVNAVPEPGTMSLIFGAGVLPFVRRQRRNA
jgi:hypothetical protein